MSGCPKDHAADQILDLNLLTDTKVRGAFNSLGISTLLFRPSLFVIIPFSEVSCFDEVFFSIKPFLLRNTASIIKQKNLDLLFP